MERALCTGIVHDGGYIYATTSAGQKVKATILTGWPPPPRTIVWLEQPVPGVWLCVGNEGWVRTTMQEDFKRSNIDVAGVLSTTDGSWWEQGSGGQAYSSNGIGPSDQGAMTITTFAGAGAWARICQNEGEMKVPAAPRAAWHSFKFRIPTLASTAFHLGMSNNAAAALAVPGANQIEWGYDPATSVGFISGRLFDNGTGATWVTPFPFVANTWHYVDVLVQGGNAPWCAVWSNGLGPYIVRSNVCINNLQSAMQLFDRNGTGANGAIDYFYVADVQSVVTPEQA